MCGLALIFGYGPNAQQVDIEELLRIRDSMQNRGPDDSGLWVSSDHSIALAHRRLSIIDLGISGHQPMATPDEKIRIVFNGEIYNYKFIRKELENKGYKFRTNSDTEVLLHLYDDKGCDMVHELRGMFAFAIWDERKRGVLLARDPLGIKPLYFSDNGHVIRVASQVKALLSGGLNDLELDPAGHVGFFLWGHVPEPYTLYKNIRALGAGKTVWVDSAGMQEEHSYFSLADEFSAEKSVSMDFSHEEMEDRLAAALRDSVKHHLVADVPVGVFLSSGLDSATLLALASESQGQQLNTVTLGFREYRGTEKDEVPLAESAAHSYGAIQHSVWVEKSDFRSELERLLGAMDQPSIDGVNTYFVSKAAVSSGLKVALSGVGGDEIFAGYPSFHQIPRMVKALSPMRHVMGFGKSFRWISAPLMKRFTSPKYAGLLEYGNNYSGAYLLRRGLFMPWELPEIMDGDMARSGWQELQPLVCLHHSIEGISSDRLKVSALELSWYMRNQLLRDADWASMAHSLELRTPFVDAWLLKDLVPLLMSNCPPGKLDMASTPRKMLGSDILKRPKTGFSVPVTEWLMEDACAWKSRGLRGWAKMVLNG